MSEIGTLSAEPRERVGKGSSREARRNGRVPAVIYGLGQDPEPITLAFNEVLKEVKKGRFLSTLFEVSVGGNKTRVIPRDLQVDVVKDFPIHVDFLRLSADAKVEVEVAVHFLNEETCPGIKRGGVLNIVRHDVELLCPADAIPEFVEADLAGLDIGDSVHISNIPLPEGVEPTIDRDFTIATISAPSGGTEDEEDTEAPEAPETKVIGEEEDEGEESED